MGGLQTNVPRSAGRPVSKSSCSFAPSDRLADEIPGSETAASEETPGQSLGEFQGGIDSTERHDVIPKLCANGVRLGEAQDSSPRRQPWDKADG